MAKEEALEKLEDIQERLKNSFPCLWPDEVVTEVYEILNDQNLEHIWVELENEFSLIDETIVRHKIQSIANDYNDKVFVERLAYYLEQVTHSAYYYLKNPYGYLEDISDEDIKSILSRAIKKVLES